ncbi:MAG: AbrB/MazE/SpoVT family DNA-binding domain-containing protein [Oscillospiraceae bacterium]|nr:AbrB/MazE/SpoVT family DNA-binding domain-containing protein [Oscillospiraceae bacterium]
MEATGIVRKVDDLGRIVIPKEIRRTLRIREGDPSYTSVDFFIRGIVDFAQHITGE